jgi:mutator family transposase
MWRSWVTDKPVGEGALGLWNALREVFPATREGRCWFHKTAKILAAPPKSAHPGAKKAPRPRSWGAEDKDHAWAAVKAFEAAYGAKFPKAATKITDDVDELLAFYDYPAEHWVHLRTTNPSRVDLRHRPAPDHDHPRAGVAQARWRAVNALHLVALVRAGATFINSKLVGPVCRVTEHRAAISVFVIPSAASSTIRARCANPARTLGERVNRSSSGRSPSRDTSAGAGRFAMPHSRT